MVERYHMTVSKAARRYGVSEQSLHDAIDNGELPLRPIRIFRLEESDVERWLRSKRPEPRQ